MEFDFYVRTNTDLMKKGLRLHDTQDVPAFVLNEHRPDEKGIATHKAKKSLPGGRGTNTDLMKKGLRLCLPDTYTYNLFKRTNTDLMKKGLRLDVTY